MKGETNDAGVDTKCTAGGGFEHCPTTPQMFGHPRWRSPGRACLPLCRQGSGTGLRRGRGREDKTQGAKGAQHHPRSSGEKWTSTRVSRALGAAFESVGAKRTAPEQGLSDRPVKRARVCSRM
jgi:hypothetical protein